MIKKPKKKLNALDIELAVDAMFGHRTNIIVPNVSWGLGLRHECDMLVVSQAGYAKEIEIKCTKGDIKADLKKKHGHVSNCIKELYFAVPKKLIDCEYLPEAAGLISVKYVGPWSLHKDEAYRPSHYRAEIVRRGRINRQARKLTERELKHLMHLGCMRIWTLKSKLNKIRHGK